MSRTISSKNHFLIMYYLKKKILIRTNLHNIIKYTRKYNFHCYSVCNYYNFYRLLYIIWNIFYLLLQFTIMKFTFMSHDIIDRYINTFS